jgi:tRNA threonylcarbamoyladenosine biosynthesis protein TsaE
MKEIICKDLSQLPQVVEALVEYGQGERVWLFEGQMGAGKTTLIKALCSFLGVQDAVHSPTYTLVNEYVAADKKKIYHFDFYRLRHEEEAFDIGYEEYFYAPEGLCLVEWASRIPNLLPNKYLKIAISVEENSHQRLLQLSKHE